MPRNNSIQLRKGTYNQWDAQSSTVLGSGEPGFITDFNKLKIGDGTSQWSDLSAINDALTTLVYNGTASTIPKMSVVYINGAQGDMPSIRLSIASGEMTSSKTYGITTNAISAGGTGMVVVDGALKNLNTSPAFDGVTLGTTLWLSPTVSGGITTTKPSAPDHMVSVGNLIRVHNQQGIINVKIQNGFELEELHNVAVTGATNGQFLQYNSGSGLWIPTSSGNFTTLNVNNNPVWHSGNLDTNSIVRTTGDQSVSGVKLFNNISINNTPLGGGSIIPLYIRTTDTSPASTAFQICNSSVDSIIDVKNDGNIAIGQVPSEGSIGLNGYASNRLHIKGATSDSSKGALRVINSSNNSLFFVRNDGNVGIGFTAPRAILDVSGVIRSTSYITSDTEFRLNNFAYSRVATMDSAGAFAGGYNVYLSGSTPKHNSAGALSSYYYSSDGSVRFYTNSSQSADTNASERLRITSSGDVGIGTTTPGYKLQVAGSFGATTKSFRIDHPSKSGWNLEYGSLESPYHGVRLTGRGTVIKGVGVVSLPAYLKDLIHDDTTLNIQITNIKHGKTIYLEEIDLQNDQFIVKADRAKSLGELEFFWTLSGVRKDVDHLVVEKEN